MDRPPIWQMIKEAVEKLIEMHGASGQLKARIDPDVEQEYSRHKEVFLQLN